jgi:hypothetical protein
MANSRYAAKTRNGSSLFLIARIAQLRCFQAASTVKNAANAFLHTLLL